MRGSLVLALVLGSSLAARSAHADDCKRSQKHVLGVMKTLDGAASTALTLWTECMFSGPDQTRVDKITKVTTRAFSVLKTLRDPEPRCIKSGDFVKAVGTVGNSVGQRLGLAWATCSPTAQARGLQLAAQGKTTEEIEQAMGQMAKDWISGITK